MKKALLLGMLVFASALRADVYLINGERVEGEVHEVNGKLTICTDEMCLVIPPGAVRVDGGAPAAAAEPQAEPAAAPQAAAEKPDAGAVRLTQGYLKPHEMLSFLRGGTSGDVAEGWEDASVWVILGLVLLGGLLMNLTPCVLPMVPINLMIIGRSAARGALYGLGIAIAYGILGVLAAVGGMAFGQIQASPWFNLVIALVFAALGLSMLGVFFIDFSRGRGGFAQKKATMLPGLFAFTMGMVSAVLAGACVAPILIAVLVFTAKMYAAGNVLALALPFVLGLGMGLPWPFAGAGLQVLPKPGAWMKWVNKAFGVLVLGFAAWYGYLSWTGFARGAAAADAGASGGAASGEAHAATPETFPALLQGLRRPVFVDCWATWCKNCAAMERTTLKDADVVAELGRFTVVRLQAEDIAALRKIPGFEGVRGLPAFAVFE